MGLMARAVHAVLVWLYRRHGWQAVGTVPEPRRFVVIAAPHSSNWDFPYYLGLTDALGLRTHFMAKDSLFRWPMGRFMREVGGVPVDRSANRDMVQQMADEFARRDEFVLTVAPEGTRGASRWKSGFYQIALKAGVPIVCGFMDYGRKVGGLGPTVWPTGDYAADLARIQAFYTGITPRHPERKGS